MLSQPNGHHFNWKHGQAIPSSRGPTYRSWECMKSRCRNMNDPSYESYGGRGISYSPEWEDFNVFLSDMGERQRGTSLDRLDVNSNYSKDNCKWSTPKDQARNKRSNKHIQYNGEKMILIELSELTGVPYQRLHERIFRRGWTVEDAVEKPARGFV